MPNEPGAASRGARFFVVIRMGAVAGEAGRRPVIQGFFSVSLTQVYRLRVTTVKVGVTHMQPIQLFDLASRQASWLSVRQEVVSTNIANANTPKYVAKDVTPFSAVLDQSAPVRMARTNPGHMTDASQVSDDVDVVKAKLDQEIGVQESGNTVGLAEELSKSGEIKRQYELNAALVKSFHRMMLLTVRK